MKVQNINFCPFLPHLATTQTIFLAMPQKSFDINHKRVNTIDSLAFLQILNRDINVLMEMNMLLKCQICITAGYTQFLRSTIKRYFQPQKKWSLNFLADQICSVQTEEY